MEQVYILFAEDEFGQHLQVVNVYCNKELAEQEAKQISSSSDMIAYVECHDLL